WRRLAEALSDQTMDHDGGCCFEGIRQVRAGDTVEIDHAGALRCSSYWSVPEEASPASDMRDDEWVDLMAGLVSDAVRLRLRSEVPLGFTLSGGIDSSLLICEAASQGRTELNAFSYQDEQHDERALIADTVERTGARLHVIDTAALDIAGLLPRVVAANGE